MVETVHGQAKVDTIIQQVFARTYVLDNAVSWFEDSRERGGPSYLSMSEWNTIKFNKCMKKWLNSTQ